MPEHPSLHTQATNNPPGFSTRKSTARQTVPRTAQAAGIIADTISLERPDFLHAMLRQTVGMTIVPFQTTTPEHQHRTTAGIKALETLLGQQLVISPSPVILVPIAARQGPRLHLVALLDPWRTVHRRRFNAVPCDRLPLPFVPLVIVVNNLTDHCNPKNASGNTGQITVPVPGSGRRCTDRCHKNGRCGDGCDKFTVHRSDPL